MHSKADCAAFQPLAVKNWLKDWKLATDTPKELAVVLPQRAVVLDADEQKKIVGKKYGIGNQKDATNESSIKQI